MLRVVERNFPVQRKRVATAAKIFFMDVWSVKRKKILFLIVTETRTITIPALEVNLLAGMWVDICKEIYIIRIGRKISNFCSGIKRV